MTWNYKLGMCIQSTFVPSSDERTVGLYQYPTLIKKITLVPGMMGKNWKRRRSTRKDTGTYCDT
jgi:hypothetical protein